MKHSAGATAQGTHDYFEKMTSFIGLNHGPRLLGKTGWLTSPLGFGCYRVNRTQPEHKQALLHALHHGVNLIDTSTNYSDGDSEKCVGETLAEAFAKGWLKREEVIVVSKAGYVQGSNLEKYRKAPKELEMVHYTDDCWHCIHPDFLQEQLDASLKRLGLQALDVFLLHNPEYFLSTAAKKGLTIAKSRTEYYRRIEAAFGFLEKAVAAGKIQHYGVSSNTLGKSKNNRESTSIDDLLKAAEQAAGSAENHFSVIQMPLNLFESDPAFAFDDSPSLTETAKNQNLGVLTNRPLNAFFNGQLIRLTEFPKEVIAHPFKQCLANVEDLETEFTQNVQPNLKPPANTGEPLFRWGQELAGIPESQLGVEHWEQIEMQVRFQTVGIIQALPEHSTDHAWKEWRDRYVRRLEELLLACRSIARETSEKTSAKISEHLKNQLPDTYVDAPLSQKAIASVLSTEGVSTVLVGMRKPDYVKDALEALKLDYAPAVENAYGAFRKK